MITMSPLEPYAYPFDLSNCSMNESDTGASLEDRDPERTMIMGREKVAEAAKYDR